MPADQQEILADLIVAAQNRRRAKRRAGGRPFQPGQPPPTNSKPFKPGESGHPGGRPKKTAAEQDFDTIAKDAAPRLLRLMVRRLRHPGREGLVGTITTPQVRLVEDIWALAGKVIPRKVEMSGPGGGPMEFEETGPARSLLLKLANEDLDDEGDGEEGRTPGAGDDSGAPPSSSAPPAPSEGGAGAP